MRKSKFNIAVFVLLVLCTAAAIGYAVLGCCGNKPSDMTSGDEYTFSHSTNSVDQSAENSNNGAIMQSAFYVSPSDICAKKPDWAQVELRCTSIVKDAVKLGFDSLVLDTYRSDKNDFIYKSDYFGYCGVDVLDILLKRAIQSGINVFPVYYVNSAIIPDSLDFESGWAYKTKAFENFVSSYSSASGFVLTDYYAEKTPQAYYMFHRESTSANTEKYFTDLFTGKLAELVSVCGATPVGLTADSFWDGGLQYPKGYIDCAYIAEGGYADFIVADASGIKNNKKADRLYTSWLSSAGSGGFDVCVLLNAANPGVDSGVDEKYASAVYKNYETLIDRAEKSDESEQIF